MITEQIKHILHNLGYKLTDKGKYWQTNAVFRDGDNRTALQIWKDTGVWRDYVTDSGYHHFRKLVESHVSDPREVNKLLKDEAFHSIDQTSSSVIETLEKEKIYPDSLLEKLLPHYKFYNERGISDETLRFFRGGLATQGKMYQRFVFPVYNEHSQIHGFAGRDMLNKENRPKWKHIGQKRNWIYPFYLHDGENFPVLDAVKKKKEIILVESVGDVLNLYDHGILNCLCTFGVDLSSTQACYLISLQLKKIVIAFNNDFSQAQNRGRDGAIKTYLKLLEHFDPHKLAIFLPTKNDFGDMNSEDFSEWKNQLELLDSASMLDDILGWARTARHHKKISVPLSKNISIAEEYRLTL